MAGSEDVRGLDHIYGEATSFASGLANRPIDELVKAALNGSFMFLLTEVAYPHKIVIASTAICKFTGYSEETFIGNSCKILQGSNTDPEVIERIRTALRERGCFTGALINYKNPEVYQQPEFHNLLIIRPVCDDHGVVTHFFSVQADITEFCSSREVLCDLKMQLHHSKECAQLRLDVANMQIRALEAEKAQLEAEKGTVEARAECRVVTAESRLQVVTAESELQVVCAQERLVREQLTAAHNTDAKSIVLARTRDPTVIAEEEKIIWANEAFCREFGYVLCDLTKLSGGDVFGMRVSELHNLVSINNPASSKQQIRCANGSEQDVLLSTLDITGASTKYAIIVYSQVGVLLQQEAESAALEMHQKLTSFVFHDARNALHCSSLLLEGILHGEQDASAENHELLLLQLQQATQVLDRAMAFRKPTAFAAGVQMTPLVVGDIVADAIKRHCALAAARSITLIAHPSSHARVMVHATRVIQVLNNIIGNAIKHCPPGSAVEVSSDGLVVAVKDNGPGIPQSKLKSIFDMYSTVGSSVSPGSFGIGLHSAKEDMRAMGGDISVESELGSGTIFTLHFKEAPLLAPAECEEAPAAPEKSYTPTGGAAPTLEGVHIAVVDDSPSCRDVLEAMLKKLGAVVALFEDGLAYYEHLVQGESKEEVLLLDNQMPGLSGIELLKAHRSAIPCKVVMMSGDGQDADVVAFKKAGADFVLTKPTPRDVLLGTVSSALLAGR